MCGFLKQGVIAFNSLLLLRRNPLSLPPSHLTRSRSLSAIATTSFHPKMPGLESQAVGVEWPAKRVRDTFLNYFTEKEHKNHKSSPVVPHNDPTLLFANAGS